MDKSEQNRRGRWEKKMEDSSLIPTNFSCPPLALAWMKTKLFEVCVSVCVCVIGSAVTSNIYQLFKI